ncbi:glycosyltransferase [Desulfovibrio litoralis]|uniref:Glycosyl transferases group 1 n=1 Tax=Desulfovibrio litoralis DSM 11393 TaxID=1121455 RepID=A0A1M7TIM7_9BACT|nr:glycosyltransferase [Desulfovibrio litoralis]SHN70629.1 Glycosyl transferases group 1 [Desulfovibrio litoralis DSM 11393]
MRSIFFIPHIDKTSGGLNNIYTIIELLQSLNYNVAFSSLEENSLAVKNAKEKNLPYIPWNELNLNEKDLFIVPEGFPNIIPFGLKHGARTIVYVQSWHYLLEVLPENVTWKQLPVEFLAVSRPVEWFIQEVFNLKSLGVLPPAVQTCFFETQNSRAKHLRIAFMPRKNRNLTQQIQQICMAKLANNPKIKIEWLEIANKTQAEVAKILSTSDIFLNTAYPEGFGLPPLEAMATGCIPVGFTGFGGLDYMSNVALENCPSVVNNIINVTINNNQTTFPENGFYVPDGDILSAALVLSEAIQLKYNNPKRWQELIINAQTTARAYNLEQQRKHIQEIWKSFEAIA